jgi:hypothetical protein
MNDRNLIGLTMQETQPTAGKRTRLEPLEPNNKTLPGVSDGFSGKGLLAAILVLAVVAIVPIFSTRYLPLHDYPFHLARMIILTHLDNPLFARFYEPGSYRAGLKNLNRR